MQNAYHLGMLVSLLLLVKIKKKGDNYFFQNDNSIRTYVSVST